MCILHKVQKSAGKLCVFRIMIKTPINRSVTFTSLMLRIRDAYIGSASKNLSVLFNPINCF
jgi:hypothetical protein